MPTSPELWLPIPSCPGYFASNHARIRRGLHKILNPWAHRPSGKLQVHIVKRHPTSAMVSRLIGEVFCPSFLPKLRPTYRDGDHTNCRPENLKWVNVAQVTVAPTGSRQGRSKLTEAQVTEIRRLHPQTPLAALAATYNVSHTSIHSVIHRTTWKHVA